MIAMLKRVMPAPLYTALRESWYAVIRLKYFRYYVYGLLFDIFHGDYRTEGMSFQIPRNLTTRNHRARFLLDTHEKEERVLVKKYIPPNACVIELGACLGVVSGVINRRLSNPGAHVAVEANPNLIPTLTVNRDRNDCKYVIESGMVSKTSDGTFYIDDCIVVSGPVQESARHIKVPVFSIEELMSRTGLKFDTLFMDIQGGELALLEEHEDVLKQLQLVILELHPHLMGEPAAQTCRHLLANAGLKNIETMGLIEVWSRKGARA